MNLIEEIDAILFNKVGFVEINKTILIEQLIKREQIGFAEWSHDNCFYFANGKYRMYERGDEDFTLDQLLEIYNERE